MRELKPEIPETSLGSKGYWLCVHSWRGLKRFVRQHVILLSVLALLAVVAVYLLRPYFQHWVISLRLFSAPVVLGALGLVAANALWLRGRRGSGAVLGLFSVLFAVLCFSPFTGPRQYVALWWQYRFVPHAEVDFLPLTRYERIHPHSAVRTLAQEATTEVQEVSDPNFVRDGANYSWTMAIEPAFPLPRMTGSVKEVLRVPADRAALNFSGENRDAVSFSSGEGMIGLRNTRYTVIKRLNAWQYFNYEPASARYLRDDDGEWVQVVPLIRWKGWILPRPVFGGVMVIPQTKGTGDRVWALLSGQGTWVPPESIASKPFLVGQNLMPAKVSTFVAESFRFTRNFFAPLPGYHLGDIRIPNLPGDQNDQPFTSYFEFDDHAKLYDYFALEPYQADKQGLNTSLFVPADGIGPTLAYRHYAHDEALTGVSAVVAKVMESRKNYDWSQNSAAEQRPFIRDIAGKRRFFWLTSVVTHKQNDNENEATGEGDTRFIVGAEPDITLTDANYKTVVWVNVRDPETWEAALAEELSTVWAHEAGNAEASEAAEAVEAD